MSVIQTTSEISEISENPFTLCGLSHQEKELVWEEQELQHQDDLASHCKSQFTKSAILQWKMQDISFL